MIQSKTIIKSLPYVFKTIDIPALGKKLQGKVRDIYFKNSNRILITTDRLSAFDIILSYIPFKGAVLNLLSEFWFKKTSHIVPNHMIFVPDPNVMLVKNCRPIPIEMIVRGYISGVTKTSIWYQYQKGERIIYGVRFPDGLKKNQKLPQPIITPTTHPPPGTKIHDKPLTKKEILKEKIIDEDLYKKMEEISLKLFNYGSKLCQEKGLILVDTKYEFGFHHGRLTLIDEIHTPDSSRFWIAKTYRERFNKGLEPENFDKEFLRLWFVKKNYFGEGIPPKIPKYLIIKFAKRYIAVYEKITGKKFPRFSYPIEKRIINNLKKYEIL